MAADGTPVTATTFDEAGDLARSQNGDLTAWGRLCRRHAPLVAAYVGARIQRPAIVERLVLQTFVSAWRRVAEADPQEVSVWLRRHAAAQANAWAKEHPLEAIDEPFPEQLCSGSEVSARSMQQLQRALLLLDDVALRVVELRYRAGLDDQAIADVLRIEAREIPGILARALRDLDRNDASLAAS